MIIDNRNETARVPVYTEAYKGKLIDLLEEPTSGLFCYYINGHRGVAYPEEQMAVHHAKAAIDKEVTR